MTNERERLLAIIMIMILNVCVSSEGDNYEQPAASRVVE